MKKSEVLACCNEATKVTFKNVALKVGDIYSNTTDGTLGIVLKFGDSLIFKKHDGEYILPENKNSMFNHEFVCNVSADANMLQQMINCGYIEDDNVQTIPAAQQQQQPQPPQAQAEQPKEEKTEVKKTAKKKEKEPKEEKTEPKLSIYEKINKVREAWKNANVEKEGHGKAGGGAKYERPHLLPAGRRVRHAGDDPAVPEPPAVGLRRVHRRRGGPQLRPGGRGGADAGKHSAFLLLACAAGGVPVYRGTDRPGHRLPVPGAGPYESDAGVRYP